MGLSQDDANIFNSESTLIQTQHEEQQNHYQPDTTNEIPNNNDSSYLSNDDNDNQDNKVGTMEILDPIINDNFSTYLEEHNADSDETAQLICDVNGSKKSYARQLSRCATNVIVIISFVAFWKIGIAFESYHVNKAPNTTPLNQTQEVCATVASSKKDNTKLDFMTFANENEIYEIDNATTKIAHCGECGSCSNLNDIGIYKSTTQTLYQNARICTYRFLVGGRRGMKRCMLKRTTLTPACLDCWVDNMLCDWQLCVFLCLRSSISMMVDRFRNAGHHDMNPCLQCDEKRCGPAFIKCAGANRRRCGIISDINRDVDNEVCTKVQI